jgi:hypothetical protein
VKPTLHKQQLREVHDKFRLLDRTWQGAQCFVERNLRIGAAAQVNRLNLANLQEIHESPVLHGFAGWQLQLTTPHALVFQSARSSGRQHWLHESK